MNVQSWVDSIAAHTDLTPAALVEAARPDTSPGHPHFEWVDSIAGEAWRLHQAATIIRRCRIVYVPATDTEDARTVRAYWPTPTPSGSRVYEPAAEIAADPFKRALMLAEMEREWKAFHRRWHHMTEFADLVTAKAAVA